MKKNSPRKYGETERNRSSCEYVVGKRKKRKERKWKKKKKERKINYKDS